MQKDKKKNTFTEKEISLLKKFNTPAKIQDFLNKIPFNFEESGDTAKSPLSVLRTGSAHCLEGALLAAYMLEMNGYRPYLLHLGAIKGDFDHTIALFKEGSLWGGLSKTNHYVLRFREPVYKSVREIAMTYFHEYFLNKNGKKTMRNYSVPIDVHKFKKDWAISPDDLWDIDTKLYAVKHYEIVPKKYIKKLRKVDEIELKAGTLVNFKPKSKSFKDPNLK